MRSIGEAVTRPPGRPRKTVREAIAMALSQRVASLLTLALVAGMSATVLLTAGRTAAAERAILASIDDVGSRAVVVRAEPKAGLDSTVVERLRRIQDAEWVGAFGPATDAANGRTGSDLSAAVRTLTATSLEPLGLTTVLPDACYVSRPASDILGLPDAAGYLSSEGGVVCDVAGRLTTPGFLEQFEPLVVIPRDRTAGTGQSDDVAVVVVLARSPEQVAAVAAATTQLAAPIDPSGMSVTASPDIARLRALVQGQLGGFGRSLTLTMMGVLAALVGALLFGLVMIRRKDFGRRRALGASRSLIVALVSLNTFIVAVVASLFGGAVGLAVLIAGGEPLPGWDFVLATLVLTTAAASLGALPPSIVASRRDPLSELRVP